MCRLKSFIEVENQLEKINQFFGSIGAPGVDLSHIQSGIH